MSNPNTIDAVNVARDAGADEAYATKSKAEASALLRGYHAPRISLMEQLARYHADGALAQWDAAVARATVAAYAVAAGRTPPTGQSLAVQASKLNVCVKAGYAFARTIARVREIVADAEPDNRAAYTRDAHNKAVSLGRAAYARGRDLSDPEIMVILTDSSSDPEKVYRMVSSAVSALQNAEKLTGDPGGDFAAALALVGEIADRWRSQAETAKREREASIDRHVSAGREDIDAAASDAVPDGADDALTL